MTEVVINRIPIRGCPGLECIVKVDANGNALDAEGEPIGGDVDCGAEGAWMVGRACVCERHWPEVCSLAGLDSSEIEREWRAAL